MFNVSLLLPAVAASFTVTTNESVATVLAAPLNVTVPPVAKPLSV